MRQSSVLNAPAQEFAALHAPVAPYTWEVRSVLLTTQVETTRIPIFFRGPLEIMGFFPTVRVNGAIQGGTRRVPTTDNVMVMLDINQQDRMTNRLESTSVANPLASYVTLSAMSVFVPRLTRIQIVNASPDVGIQFRWDQDPQPGGVPIYENALVQLAFFCRYLDEVG
jgi:hypothetical protein